MADLVGEPEPVEPAGSEHDGIEPALSALPQTRVDVPPQRLDRERRLAREQLSAPAHGGGPDPHPGADPVGSTERVAWVLARRIRADDEAVRVSRGHVLRGVHGDVDPSVQQRLLQLLDEDTALADLAERLRPVPVARSRDRDERDLDAGPAQPFAGQLGLREREPTSAASDSK